MDVETVLVAAMFATLFLLLLTGFPVAFILAGTGLIFAVLGEILNAGGIRVDAHLGFLGFVTNRFFTSATSLALIPIPLFIFMGFMLDRSGVAHRLMGAMQRVLGRLPGGLAVSVTVIGVILAASTGIIGASVVLLATVALPNMLKQGYSVSLATGTIGAAGCLGVLIPPIIMLVVMADQMTLSVGSPHRLLVGEQHLLGGDDNLREPGRTRGQLIFPNLAHCKEIAGIQEDTSPTEILTCSSVREAFEAALARHNRKLSGSSRHVVRALVLDEDPRIYESELTEKRYLNQRLAAARREAVVEGLFGPDPPPATIVFEKSLR